MSDNIYIVVHRDAHYYGDRHVVKVFRKVDDAEDFIKDVDAFEIDEHEIY